MYIRNKVDTLSIITPILNGEAFIEACLRNVISQNCNQVEHIIIDGASTDGTMVIVQHYAAKYPHIRWVSEPDQGQSDAMNKGIRLAQGEVIGFLNVDDYYESGVLNRVISLLNKLPVPSFLVGNCYIWDEYGQIMRVNKPKGLTFFQMFLGPGFQNYPENPTAYFYHRCLHNLAGYYDINEHFALDIDMLFRLVQVANIHYVDEHWGNHRFLPGTKTYIDTQRGSIYARVPALKEKYRKELTSFQRLQLFFVYPFVFLWDSACFFRNHPEELPGRLKNRFLFIFKQK